MLEATNARFIRLIRRIWAGLSAAFLVFFLECAEDFFDAVERVALDFFVLALVWETAEMFSENSSTTSSADRILTK